MSSSRPGVSISGRGRPALAVAARCDDDELVVELSDGRTVRVPLTERLRAATPEQRRDCRIEDFGAVIRWDALDEDVSVAGLLGVAEDDVLALAGLRPGLPKT